jgi:hypothetical protein
MAYITLSLNNDVEIDNRDSGSTELHTSQHRIEISTTLVVEILASILENVESPSQEGLDALEVIRKVTKNY